MIENIIAWCLSQSCDSTSEKYFSLPQFCDKTSGNLFGLPQNRGAVF
jgi:hypothetical protein